MEQLLTTKLYIPRTRTELVPRPHLIEQINASLPRKLTLISAPVGFGKTTLVSEWVQTLEVARPSVAIAWLSLDENDSDLTRFLIYIIAALQTVDAKLAQGVIGALQSSQPLSAEPALTAVINEINAIPEKIVLILDDYHMIDASPVDKAVTFLLEHLTPNMHLVITTREDPNLPLARLRARGQLTELRIADLRFTPAEAAEFLNQVMGLNLTADEIEALETRTEGWIAGLQLAALSMQGREDVRGFITAFAGDNRYIVDYLVDEVLERQPERIRSFLLQTSILERLSGPLCDAVVDQADGEAVLEALERANLFIYPLDDQRRWFRYHPLFADVLRAHAMQEQPNRLPILRRRASEWYEENGFVLEAFQHAAAANDIERAACLIEGEGMPLHFRGAMAPVLNWLESLPTAILDARPSLWVTYALASTMVGKPIGRIEEILQDAEAALEAATPNNTTPDQEIRDLIGQIASIRAMLAVPQNQVETMVAQSRRALEYLDPDNLAVRTTATWTLGYAYQLQGERTAASETYTEAISISQTSGNTMITIAAATCLGQVEESETKLKQAAETYQRVLELAGKPQLPGACEAHLGLARIHYQWNELDVAQQHGQQSLQLAQQMENVDTPAASRVMLGRLKLARGDTAGAIVLFSKAEKFLHQHHSAHRMPEVSAAQVLALLRQGDLEAAAELAEKQRLPISQARVYLASGDSAAAMAILEPLRREAEAKDWQDQRLEVKVLQALALQGSGEKDRALQALAEALALAEPGDNCRIFVDEGAPMAQLLEAAAARGIKPEYTGRLLALLEAELDTLAGQTEPPSPSWREFLTEPLSQRELEVLQLVAQGLSNREISERLFLSVNTVKGYNRTLFGKLQVRNRTEAVARARQLGIL